MHLLSSSQHYVEHCRHAISMNEHTRWSLVWVIACLHPSAPMSALARDAPSVPPCISFPGPYTRDGRFNLFSLDWVDCMDLEGVYSLSVARGVKLLKLL